MLLLYYYYASSLSLGLEVTGFRPFLPRHFSREQHTVRTRVGPPAENVVPITETLRQQRLRQQNTIATTACYDNSSSNNNNVQATAGTASARLAAAIPVATPTATTMTTTCGIHEHSPHQLHEVLPGSVVVRVEECHANQFGNLSRRRPPSPRLPRILAVRYTACDERSQTCMSTART